jgi:uncharacterized membrane protein (UPF0127 family)
MLLKKHRNIRITCFDHLLLIMKTIIQKISLFIILIALSTILFPKSKFLFIYIKSHRLLTEIADTPELTAKGLMYRKSIPKDYAMLFIFENEEPRGFWMKNTLIPLDIIFLNKNKEIINIAKNVPPCKQSPCKSYYSKKPAKYVVEIRGGLSKKMHIKAGDTIEFLQ